MQARLRSLPQITAGAMATGHINFVPDNDGVNRRNLLVIDSGEALTPSLGLAAAMALLGESQFEVSDFELHVGERKVPVDQRP